MRLDELYGIRNNPDYLKLKKDLYRKEEYDEVLSNFLVHLKNKGFEPMGSGSFGLVFTHPTLNYAIKIFHSDPAYLSFVSWCISQKDNPHVPRFIGKPITIDHLTFMIRMEKLSKKLSAEHYDVAGIIHIYSDKDFSELEIALLEKFPKFIKNNPKFIPTLKHIFSDKRNAFMIDLHNNNFMTRLSDKKIVITDPYSIL